MAPHELLGAWLDSGACVQKSPPLRKGRNAAPGGPRRDHDHIPAHHDPGMIVSFNQVAPLLAKTFFAGCMHHVSLKGVRMHAYA